MQLFLTGRHVEVTPALRQLVGKRLARLERLLNDSAVSAQVVLSLQKRQLHTELTVHARGDHLLAGSATGKTWQESIGLAVEKVMQQALKVKDKWRTRKRRASGVKDATARRTTPRRLSVPPNGAGPSTPAKEKRIVRATRYVVKPMRTEDAALQIAESRESFLVFRDADSDRVNILFVRPDGRLGLIDPGQ